MAILAGNPLHLHLTEAFLVENGIQPLVAGDDVVWRFRVGDASGAAVSLSGTLILLHLRDALDVLLVTRRSDTNITSTSIKQIEADADQTVEDTVNETGKGWLSVRFSDEDESALLAITATVKRYGLRLKLADGTVRVVCQGRIEVVRPDERPVT